MSVKKPKTPKKQARSKGIVKKGIVKKLKSIFHSTKPVKSAQPQASKPSASSAPAKASAPVKASSPAESAPRALPVRDRSAVSPRPSKQSPKSPPLSGKPAPLPLPDKTKPKAKPKAPRKKDPPPAVGKPVVKPALKTVVPPSDKAHEKRPVSKEATPAQKPAQVTAVRRMEKRKVHELKRELEQINKKHKEEILLKDAEGRHYCREENCDQSAVTDMYCRYHYLALWKYHRVRKQLLEDRYLPHTIQKLMKSFGEPALHVVLKDFKSEKTFETAAREMSFFTGKEEDTANATTEGF